jgi:hypothetical protein
MVRCPTIQGSVKNDETQWRCGVISGDGGGGSGLGGLGAGDGSRNDVVASFADASATAEAAVADVPTQPTNDASC